MLNAPEAKPLTSERFIQPSAVCGHERAPERADYSIFVPLLILAGALVAWFAFQTIQLQTERRDLAVMKASQESQVAIATKIRTSLDSLASSTQRLANSGNANAQLIVDELRKRGVTIKTP
ncbi:MAG: hypothetical protein ABI120_19315 [Gemmatimonadaceae bacterium]